ncbi:MAG: Gfo/Idh/MocA family oxidoreductase [Clostridia bacterium]|nr:Gfo/Idh/MocA family oxidoreductase [Clostridia bacterium]
MERPIEIAIVGCGNRGRVYGQYALDEPGRMRIKAVVEPNVYRRELTGDKFGVPADMRFGSLDAFISSGTEVDAVINATMDREHYATARAIIGAGYDMLIEKPVCLAKDELMELYGLAVEKGVRVMVCHVLRYAPFYVEIKKRILSGELGDIHSMVTEENVSFHHYATAFVRGKWGNSDVCGSQILMSKCCHDLDIITWLKSGTAPSYVASFGGLFNYIDSRMPAGAGERCTAGCGISENCEYDAGKMYVGKRLWNYYATEYLDSYADRDSQERLGWSLGEKNPYGRCVWKCDNNVMDHQTVMIEFEDGCTVSHNLLGGTAKPDRTIHIAGTKGEIYGSMESGSFCVRKPDLEKPEQYNEETVDIKAGIDGHGGGDLRLAADFVSYIKGEGTSVSTTELGDSIYGHLIGFGAHEAMTGRKVVAIRRLKHGKL